MDASLRRVDGYLPIEDHGLVGDGTTAALIGRDGGVSWLCAPRFDSPALFCGLLDRERGGAFSVAPEPLVGARQWYEPDSAVLVTELQGPDGTVQVTDALALREGADLAEDAPAGRGELLRCVEVVDGRVRLRVELEPRDGAFASRRAEGLALRPRTRPELDLHLASSHPLEGPRSTLDLAAGDRLDLVLRWGGHSMFARRTVEQRLEATRAAWRRWLTSFQYKGLREPLVRRSAITLKLLDHFASGAIVAAPTSSLPEAIGGQRNWDYRYTWIRDAAYSVYALRRVGLTTEAWAFLAWVLSLNRATARPAVLYDIDGNVPAEELIDPQLDGYRASAPVRWGNAAGDQHQHDVFGEIVDCAYQWAAGGGELADPLWSHLRPLVEQAGIEWRQPDHGIWEVRSAGRPFTYSAAMCQVALDRGARLAERHDLPGKPKRWRAEADRIRTAILTEAWDDDVGAITENLGGGGLDASVLALPLRRVIPADHPRMVATTAAVQERLGAGDGLLYRYLPDVSPDGLEGHEGAFVLCSFWLVDNLAGQGRLEEAAELYESLCDRATPLGLLAEQVDPASGAFLGNFPQAFSHIGVISSGLNLARRGATA